MNRAVFLDRDGVINPLVYNLDTNEYESPHYMDDFSIFPYTAESLKLLQERDFKLFLISNQPSFAKGKTPFRTFNKYTVLYINTCSCMVFTSKSITIAIIIRTELFRSTQGTAIAASQTANSYVTQRQNITWIYRCHGSLVTKTPISNVGKV